MLRRSAGRIGRQLLPPAPADFTSAELEAITRVDEATAVLTAERRRIPPASEE